MQLILTLHARVCLDRSVSFPDVEMGIGILSSMAYTYEYLDASQFNMLDFHRASRNSSHLGNIMNFPPVDKADRRWVGKLMSSALPTFEDAWKAIYDTHRARHEKAEAEKAAQAECALGFECSRPCRLHSLVLSEEAESTGCSSKYGNRLWMAMY